MIVDRGPLARPPDQRKQRYATLRTQVERIAGIAARIIAPLFGGKQVEAHRGKVEHAGGCACDILTRTGMGAGQAITFGDKCF